MHRAVPIQRLAGLALWSLTALGSPALAQLPESKTPTGSRVPRPIPFEDLKSAETRVVQAKFGDCLVRKHREEAKLIVLRYPIVPRGDSPGRTALRKLTDGSCLLEAVGSNIAMAKLQLPGDALWYILAEALFRLELGGQPAISELESVGPLQHVPIDESESAPIAGSRRKKADLEKIAKQRSEAMSVNYLSRFGECVVRANPSGTLKLLSSAIRSAEENAAFDGLSPTFKSCLLDEHTAVFNRFSIRGTLAYNYYRLAHARGNAAKPAGAIR